MAEEPFQFIFLIMPLIAGITALLRLLAALVILLNFRNSLVFAIAENNFCSSAAADTQLYFCGALNY